MESYNNSSKTSNIPLAVVEAWCAGKLVVPFRSKENPARPTEIIPRRQPTFEELFEWQDRYQPAAWVVIGRRMGIPYVAVHPVGRNENESSDGSMGVTIKCLGGPV